MLGLPGFLVENIPSGNWVAQGTQQETMEQEREFWSTSLSQQCDVDKGEVLFHGVKSEGH